LALTNDRGRILIKIYYENPLNFQGYIKAVSYGDHAHQLLNFDIKICGYEHVEVLVASIEKMLIYGRGYEYILESEIQNYF
jgi:hypothetical protein